MVPHSEKEAEGEQKEFSEKVARLRAEGKLVKRPEGLRMEVMDDFADMIDRIRDSVLGTGAGRRRFYCMFCWSPTLPILGEEVVEK